MEDWFKDSAWLTSDGVEIATRQFNYEYVDSGEEIKTKESLDEYIKYLNSLFMEFSTRHSLLRNGDIVKIKGEDKERVVDYIESCGRVYFKNSCEYTNIQHVVLIERKSYV